MKTYWAEIIDDLALAAVTILSTAVGFARVCDHYIVKFRTSMVLVRISFSFAGDDKVSVSSSMV